jgi:hypothetical protein
VFALALVFYEMVTRVLPTWPFRWPFDRHERLASSMPPALVPIIRRAASFDLSHRYRDAGAMLAAVHRAVPDLAGGRPKPSPDGRRLTWQQYRQREFEQRFGRRLVLDFRCNRCSGPISEFMLTCPWCGFEGNSFVGIGTFPAACAACEHGIHDDWRYCPWCYGSRFRSVSRIPSRDSRYGGRCPNPRCRETRLLPHMRHCPWCNARLRPWRSLVLQGRCPACKCSVANDYWDHCPWCGKDLSGRRRTSGRRRS